MPTNIRTEYILDLHLHLRRCRATRINTAPSCSGPLQAAIRSIKMRLRNHPASKRLALSSNIVVNLAAKRLPPMVVPSDPAEEGVVESVQRKRVPTCVGGRGSWSSHWVMPVTLHPYEQCKQKDDPDRKPAHTGRTVPSHR